MKYIYENDGIRSFNEYFKYIQSIEKRLPKHVFDFAINQDHYNLSSRSSLHDACLISLEIKQLPGSDHGSFISEIAVTLLGPYHDRHINLLYKNVKAYSLQCRDKNDPTSQPNRLVGVGDLLVHEVRLSDNESLIHEIEFEFGDLMIECEDFEHVQRMLN